MSSRVNFQQHVVRYFEHRDGDHVKNVMVRHPNGMETFLGEVALEDLDGRLVRVYQDYDLAEAVVFLAPIVMILILTYEAFRGTMYTCRYAMKDKASVLCRLISETWRGEERVVPKVGGIDRSKLPFWRNGGLL